VGEHESVATDKSRCSDAALQALIKQAHPEEGGARPARQKSCALRIRAQHGSLALIGGLDSYKIL
jgi:hypothetical protein